MRSRVLDRRRGEFRERFPTHFCAPCGSILYPEDTRCPECNASPPSVGWPDLTTSEDRLLGRVLGERYLLTRRIGTGASARVYRATSLNIAREFAIKLMRVHPDGGVNRKRLDKEVEALSCLRNPHFATIYEVLELYDDYVALVMDLAEGDRLDTLVERDGALDPLRAIKLARQIANGIGEAHAAGFVHRDLKPENIIVERMPAGDDFVRILDLGIVYVTGDPRRTNGFLGSPLYASPEQVKVGRIDSRSDLYSLGAVLYFLLVGEAPFMGQTAEEVLRGHALEPVSTWRLRELIGPVGTSLVLDLLAKDPNDRPITAQIVVDRLDAIAQNLAKNLDELSEPRFMHETPINGTFARANTPRSGVQAVLSGRSDHQVFEVPIEMDSDVIAVDGGSKLTRVVSQEGGVSTVGPGFAHKFGPVAGAICVCGPSSGEFVVVGTAFGEVFVCHNKSTRLVFREDTLTQITSIAWSNDGVVAFGTTSGRVYFGSIDETEWVPAASGSPVTAVSLSPNGELVVIARDTGLVDVRRVTDGTDVVSWAMKSAAQSIAFSHDGYLVSTLASDNIISLHQSTSGRAIIAFDPGRPLIAVRFDDGDRLVGFYATGFGVRGLRLHGMKAG